MMSWLANEEKRLAISPDELLNHPLLKDLENSEEDNHRDALEHWRAILIRAKHEGQPVLATLSTYKPPPDGEYLDLDPMQLAMLLARISYILYRVVEILRREGRDEARPSLNKAMNLLEVIIDAIELVVQDEEIEGPSALEIYVLAHYLRSIVESWLYNPPGPFPKPIEAPPETQEAISPEPLPAPSIEPSEDPSENPLEDSGTTQRLG